MTSFGFVISVILLILKVVGFGVFATISWWIVALPLLIAVAIDILFSILGFAVFRRFTR